MTLSTHPLNAEQTGRPTPVPGQRDLWRTVLENRVRGEVTLVSDLYSASPEPGPRPVVLERTPYGRRRTRASDGAFRGENPAPPETVCRAFVERGYHVLRQDCRGRGDSGGTFVKYLDEADDGFDTVEWIARQPWCDGRVLTMGVSYAAHAQSALASRGPTALAAMFLDSGGFSSAYDNGIRMGGAFELKQATWALSRVRVAGGVTDSVALEAVRAEPVEEWFANMPWRRGLSPLRHVPAYEDYLFEQWEHEDFGPYWKQPGIYARDSYHRFPDVPSLHVSSWYDPYVTTAVENFQRLRELHSSRVELVLGPWTHGRRSVSHAGDVDFGPRAPLDGNLAEDYVAMRLAWFDTQLDASAETDRPAVRYFLMGGGGGGRNAEGRLDHGGSWRQADTWPPEGSSPLELHPGADGSLSEVPAPHDARVTYRHDPRDPVPTIGGQVTSGEPVMAGGAFDQRPGDHVLQLRPSTLPLAARQDVVTFQTAPLTEPVAITGPVVLHVGLSSTAVDTDVTIKLVDVHPPTVDHPAGYAMNLTEGILRCRYRSGFEEPVPLEPGVVHDVVVKAPDTANLFAVGHRIRLDVSSSNFPRFDVNPGTGRSPAVERTPVAADNTLHLGRSRLVLQALVEW